MDINKFTLCEPHHSCHHSESAVPITVKHDDRSSTNGKVLLPETMLVSALQTRQKVRGFISLVQWRMNEIIKCSKRFSFDRIGLTVFQVKLYAAHVGDAYTHECDTVVAFQTEKVT